MMLCERLDMGRVVVASVVAILGGFACSSQGTASSGVGGAPGSGGELDKGMGGFADGNGGTAAGGSGSTNDGGLQGAPCSRVADCASGFTCGYKVSDGCAAQGICVPVTPAPGAPACGALTMHCGCDGVTTVTGGCNFFADYAPAPVMSGLFECPNDAGASSDGGSSCTGWGGSGVCCAGLVYMPSASTALPGHCVKP